MERQPFVFWPLVVGLIARSSPVFCIEASSSKQSQSLSPQGGSLPDIFCHLLGGYLLRRTLWAVKFTWAIYPHHQVNWTMWQSLTAAVTSYSQSLGMKQSVGAKDLEFVSPVQLLSTV